MANVSIKNVTKIYDKNKVIDNVSLEIKDKEFLVLVGSSGCGKSTLLRMIAGLETITAGEIFIDGKKVNDVHPKDRDIAMVFQSYALYPHMTVKENIAFPLKMRNVDKKVINEKVENAAKILNLTDLLDRRPKQLSGGQRQRVALGRAIVRNPKVFLMDEPLSNLDAKLRVQMRAEIKKLHKELDTTFIYVTHDQTEALTMGDRIALLDKGVIQQLDTPENMYNCPNNTFVGAFLGAPGMNFFKSEIIDNSIIINNQKIELLKEQNVKLNGAKEIIVGIRPELLYVSNYDTEIKVSTTLVEMLGSEKLAHIEINNKHCSVRLPSNLEQTDNISLKFNKSDLQFFDIKTKNVLN